MGYDADGAALTEREQAERRLRARQGGQRAADAARNAAREQARRRAAQRLEAEDPWADAFADGPGGRAGAAEPVRGATRRSAADALAARQHDARKRKADRLFDRTVRQDAPAQEGSRAAVYRGEMGSTHKKSSRMRTEQETARRTGRATAAAAPAGALGVLWRFRIPLALVAVLAFAALFLYAPARDAYVAVRNEAKAQAELDILQSRNDALNTEIGQLSTDEGIEDRARRDYGWVKEGENAVIVTGVGGQEQEGIESADASAFVSATDVAAPDTWYSGMLDPFFGYDG